MSNQFCIWQWSGEPRSAAAHGVSRSMQLSNGSVQMELSRGASRKDVLIEADFPDRHVGWASDPEFWWSLGIQSSTQAGDSACKWWIGGSVESDRFAVALFDHGYVLIAATEVLVMTYSQGEVDQVSRTDLGGARFNAAAEVKAGLLIETEFSLLMLSCTGAILWRHDFSEIISSVEVVAGQIQVQLFDERRIKLDAADGRVL